MALVGDALERPGAERSAWLAEQCGSDAALFAEANSLLMEETAASHTELTGQLQERVLRAARTIAFEEWSSRIGERVGSYRLVDVIGHGGMGTVYLAERADEQYRARTAIKFVRGLLAAPELERRFRAERQILADLNHPNIARLLDGGVARDGTPYLVMEYVDGQPIDAWSDAHGLDVRARIELFLRVCDAAAYAHRSGVVHRDLKPTNILVTPDGMPKLVDFGIAKLVGQTSEPEQTGQLRVMTPTHASPEQVRGGPISFSTDIYSLGVVLYELLAGRTPFELDGASIGEIERQICTARPAPPSEAATGHAVNWRRQLEGPLDEIVLRALSKQPERRHESVSALAESLQRFLNGPPRHRITGLLYSAKRWGRRPAVWMATGVALTVAAASGAFVRSRMTGRPEPLGSFRFLPAQEAATPFPIPYQVHTGDLDGDGRADLLWNFLGAGSNQTRVALSLGDGTFAYKAAFSYPHRPADSWGSGYELVIGDFSGDGADDLAWYRPDSRPKTVYVAVSNRNGSFRALEPYSFAEVFRHVWRMYAADADGNGRDDLILNHLQDENVSRVYRSNGDGTFRLGPNVLHPALYWGRYRAYVGDADGDGQPDFIWNDVPGGINRTYVARSLDSLVMLPWQDHPITVVEDLPPERSRWTGFMTQVADINGDRIADIVWIAPDRNPMPIYRALGQSTGQFRFMEAQYASRPTGAETLVSLTGDLNADGRADLLLHETGPRSRLWVALGSADGSFVFEPMVREHPDGAGGNNLLVADITGDGRSNIIWHDRSPNSRVYVALPD